jgi:adenosylcobinamide kinase/adenosylcobinamide-phosphate guanylyltransferase
LKEIVFVVGGCRSGKSRYALETANEISKEEKIFIATCVPHDAEMKQRVDRHQKERGPNWQTAETPVHLPQTIAARSRQAKVLLVDCLTLWISNLMLGIEDDEIISERIGELVQSFNSLNCPLVLVSNEVGTGIVPENRLARRFRDLVGEANQAVAARADRVVWMVAGIPVMIKGNR